MSERQIFHWPQYRDLSFSLLGNIECCAQCDEPKFPLMRIEGEGGCINPMCIAFGEQQSSVSFKGQAETILNLQARLNAFREWIISQGFEIIFGDEP